MRGTLLNTATVTAGALLGLAVGRFVPIGYEPIVISGLGLVTLGLGAKLFLGSKNVLVVAAAVALGGALGHALGLHAGVESLAAWAQATFGGTGRFSEAIITTFVLFCIGPMTLLGCLQDGLERRIELLAVKSTLDGFGAFFFAATLGPGVLVTAALLFLWQGSLTLLARPLRPLAENPALIDELSGAGGAIMLAIGLGLLRVADLPTADYLPALALAPLLQAAWGRWERGRSPVSSEAAR
jgi:uncharacterized protein